MRIILIWKRLSLGRKVAIFASALVSIVVIVLMILNIQREQDSFQRELRSQADLVLDLVAYTSRDALYKGEVSKLTTLVGIVHDQANIVGSRFYNADGALLVDSAQDSPLFAQQTDSIGTTLVNLPADQTYFELRDNQLLAGRVVTVGRDTLGAALVIMSTAPLETKIADLQTESIVVALVVVLLSIGATILLVHWIARPLEDLQLAAVKMSTGDLSVRVTEGQSSREIDKLGHAFNQMAEQLQTSVETLKVRVVEAQEARERAETADKVKSAFLASMSHELRTPLNSVINFTKFVVKGVMGPVTERQTESLNKVVDSAKHLLSLINDVLDMSKIESGSLNLFIEDDIDVATILRTVASTAEGLLDEKPVKLQLEIDENLPPMRGDKQRIRQIMLNLVSNACKFTEDGTITISAHSRANEIQIDVRDSGPGIDAEDSAAVFEPFKQTETGLRQGAGTGLGMPISKSLAEAHGGRLWFDSTPGQGTVFYVTLPVKSESLTPVVA